MSAGTAVLRLVGVGVALLLLLALTVISAYMPLREVNLVLNLLIAIVKALLVMFAFMHLRARDTTIRLVAGAGLLWLLLLITLTLADLLTRQPSPLPW
jgi:cytochrome c oxidase subunit 4